MTRITVNKVCSCGFGILAALLAGLLSPPVYADVTTEPIDGVSVENAHATVARRGGGSRVHFQIDNASGRDLTLVGVSSNIAGSGSLVSRRPVVGVQDITPLFVASEETLDLASSHLWAELRDLNVDLNVGDIIEFELQFRSGIAKAAAHVHLGER